MIDVDQRHAAVLQEIHAHALERAAVEVDDRALGEVVGLEVDRAVFGEQVAVLVGQRELGLAHEHDGVLAQLPAASPFIADQRTEGVAVRVLVRGEQKLLVALRGVRGSQRRSRHRLCSVHLKALCFLR